MTGVVDQALLAWGISEARYTLAANRENQVYRVAWGDQTVALRLHRPGYRRDAQLASELAWMAALSDGGMSVPAPLPARSGELVVTVGGVQVDVLTWLPGAMLVDCLPDLSAAERARTFFKIGRQMAVLHDVSDAWSVPPAFQRDRWDCDGLVGTAPLWDRFWTNPGLSNTQRLLLMRFRTVAQAELRDTAQTRDFGLIHADLVPANVLYDAGELSFIDFDDGGWGFRLFDVATALLKHRDAADYTDLKAALIKGYAEVRPLDVSDLDLMMCLRALTYVGWNITRMTEPGGADRNARFIRTACALCATYLQDR